MGSGAAGAAVHCSEKGFGAATAHTGSSAEHAAPSWYVVRPAIVLYWIERWEEQSSGHAGTDTHV